MLCDRALQFLWISLAIKASLVQWIAGIFLDIILLVEIDASVSAFALCSDGSLELVPSASW